MAPTSTNYILWICSKIAICLSEIFKLDGLTVKINEQQTQ